MKNNKKHSNRNKDLIIGVFSYILFFIASCLVVSFTFIQINRSEKTSKADTLLSTIYNECNRQLNETYDFSRIYLYNEDFAHLARNYNEENEQNYFSDIVTYFDNILTLNPSNVVNGVGFIPQYNGKYNVDVRCYEGSNDFFRLYNEEVRIYLSKMISECEKEGRERGKIFVLEEFGEEEECVLLVRVIRDISSPLYKDVLGISFFTLSKSKFIQSFSPCSTLEGLNVLLYNQDTLLYGYDKNADLSKKHYESFRLLDIDPLRLVAYLDFSSVLVDIFPSLLTAALIFSGLLAIFIVVFIISNKHYKKGVNYLFDSFDQLEKEKSLLTISPVGEEDIDRVVNSYNDLVYTIQNEMEKNEKVTNEKQVLEMENLSVQINKHFVVNVLSVVRSMVNLNKQIEAKEMLENLSDFLRYSLNINDKDTTIENEVNQISKYLAIQKLRYENISFNIECDEKSKGIKVPRMILQPLVENIFTHGEEESEREINISSKLIHNSLHICISNKGYIEDSELKKINSKIKSEITETTSEVGRSTNGIALRNIYKRLNIFFSNNAKVYLKCRDNRVSAHIDIMEVK